jgi:translation initiation factor IF-1
MVKNYGGGDKMKHMARKHVNGAKNAQSSKLLRTASCSDEKYGYVVRILGNGNCIVKGFDGYERMCHIRGKFTGRSKRENTLVAGTWVLVGLRQWDTEKEFATKQTKTSKNIQKCDLLEIYTPAERDKLRVQEKIFQDIDSENSDDEFKLSKQSVEFKDEETLEYQEIVEQGGNLSRMKKSSYLDIYDNISSSDDDSEDESRSGHSNDDEGGDGGEHKKIQITEVKPTQSASGAEKQQQVQKQSYKFQNEEINIDEI